MTPPAAFIADDMQSVRAVYDGANVTLRFLRALGWGPALLNLGYFPCHGCFNALNVLPGRFRLAAAQQRLLRRAARLLAPESGEQILDIACGRGQSSFYIAASTPGAAVVGIDWLEENIQVASTLFGGLRSLRYECGDAQALQFAEASFDKALCLEAAFHFADKQRFLLEAARVLKPGGRMVLVDFMWRQREHAALLNDPRTKLVQQIWGWQDFFAREDYLAAARAANLLVEGEYDWSAAVTHSLDVQFDWVTRLAATTWGRRFVTTANGMLGGFSRADWRELRRAAEAHRFVNSHSLYGVLVLSKPT